MDDSIGAAVALAVFTALGSAAGATETADSCGGRSLLPSLAASDPLVYTRILRDAETAENGRAVLWKLERTGFEPSYLLGTVHLTDERVSRLSEAVRAALSGSKTLLIENANLSPEETQNAYTAANKRAVFNDGRSLDKLLTPDEFEKVRIAIQGVGVPAAAARIYRPWMISMLLAASECERRRMEQGHLVLDMAIAEHATKLGIPIAGVETTDDQLAALAAVPEQEQVGMLRANLALVGLTDDLLETMVDLYVNRRIGAIWDLQIALAKKAGVSPDAFATFKKTLVVERNRKMRDAALAHIEKGATFIAVGALHLPGSTGLVAMLREIGFTATALE